MKRVVVLGSTGSIGTSALDVMRRDTAHFKIVGLAANNNIELLARQSRYFNVKKIAVGNTASVRELKKKIPSGVKIYPGIEGVREIARLKEADIVVAAIGGTEASLKSLIAAVGAGKRIALASKEALVSAGDIVMKLARDKKADIIPVDSEHSAIFQCLVNCGTKDVKTLYLTGTGGPLRKVKKSFFDRLPISRVMKHPKWKMGRKITVDSATLMNKGLEVIEAKHLFGMKPEDIKVLLHPEAIIHSMVEFNDGSVMANLFYPDMRLPLFYALNFPERKANLFPKIDFFKIKNLTFEKPSFRKFPALELAYDALRKGASTCAVLNAANEEAVSLYLEGRMKFTGIVDTVRKVMKLHRAVKNPSLNDILDIDRWAREETKRLC